MYWINVTSTLYFSLSNCGFDHSWLDSMNDWLDAIIFLDTFSYVIDLKMHQLFDTPFLTVTFFPLLKECQILYIHAFHMYICTSDNFLLQYKQINHYHMHKNVSFYKIPQVNHFRHFSRWIVSKGVQNWVNQIILLN